VVFLRRYEELDSLRGLAALSVMFGHLLSVFSSNKWTMMIEYGPLRSMVAASEAVSLFFILSGFVLVLPFLSGKTIIYSSYFLKRAIRIYSPFIAVILLSFLASHLLYSGNVDSLSDWFNKRWGEPFDPILIFQHLLLIGDYNNDVYSPVIWSLIHEMRISIIFPFIAWFIIRNGFKNNILFMLLVILISILLKTITNSDSSTSLASTIYYSHMFIVGALIAKHKDIVVEKAMKINKRYLILALSFFLYIYTKPSFALNFIFPNGLNIFHRAVIDNIFVVIGGSLLIFSSLSYKNVSKILLNKPFIFLGKISYSLYLYHCLVLLTLIHVFSEIVPISFILITTITLSILFSYLSYKYIEIPSIKLGRKLAGNISTKKRDRSVTKVS
jgi:peptidoglycan/LPS O-acetylase OafA/YrhL